MTLRLLLAAIPLLPSSPALAVQDKSPGQSTVWDQMMAEQAVHHLQRGYESFSAGDYEKATLHFARAVVSNPDDARTHVMLGVAHYWSGRVDQAMAAYREALKLDAKNAQAHQLLGIAFAWKGDMPAARAEFEEGVRLAPDRADIHMDLGSVYQSLGMVQEALESFRKAVSLDPKYPLYHFQLGILYDQLGRESDAADSLKEAVRLYPDYQDAILQLGSLKERANDLPGAAGLFKKAVRLKPGDAVARLRLAIVHLEQSEPERARRDLERAFQLSPGSEGGRLALSQAYRGAGPEGAPGSAPSPLDAFRKNLERIPPGREARIETKITFVKVEPLKLDDRREGAPKTDGKAGGPSASQTSRTFSLKPADPESRRQQIQTILAELKTSLDNAPKGSEAGLNMNINYPAQQEYGQESSREVAYEPRRVGNDLNLWVQGSIWVDLVEEALPMLVRRLQQHPKDATALVLLGLAHLTLGHAAEARFAFETALEQDPKDAEALLGLGVANVIAGSDEAALAAYRKVLELQPKNTVAKQSIKWLTEPAKQ